MSPDHSTSLHIEAKRTYTPKKVVVASHDCQPEITLTVAGKKGTVEREIQAGVDLAKDWLFHRRDNQGLRLDEEAQRIRHMVGELRWPTVAMGFLARIDQRLAALETNYPVENVIIQIDCQSPPELSKDSLIIGNHTMKLMLDQLNFVANLARSGELRPSSQQAGKALEAVAELVSCIEMVGPVDLERDEP